MADRSRLASKLVQ